MEKISFGYLKDGSEAFLYRIKNSSGMTVDLTNYGAAIVKILVPDRDGKMTDVVLGYDDVSGYESSYCYFGAIVGRNCNRIANAELTIDSVTYKLDDYDRGNNLHSGFNGVSRKLWNLKDSGDNYLVFEIISKDLEQGFPGNADIEVRYELGEDNKLGIYYTADSDKKTVFNMTNHSYFNLSGHDSGDVLDQEVMIKASHFTPIKDECSIPTGEILPVDNTPFDFRQMKAIGRDIGEANKQLVYANGYDHNYALDKTMQKAELMAEAYSKKTGIKLSMETDCIAMQFYTANKMIQQGKNEVLYHSRSGFCFETQYFPNSVNEPNFASPIFEAGEIYRSYTSFKFSVE